MIDSRLQSLETPCSEQETLWVNSDCLWYTSQLCKECVNEFKHHIPQFSSYLNHTHNFYRFCRFYRQLPQNPKISIQSLHFPLLRHMVSEVPKDIATSPGSWRPKPAKEQGLSPQVRNKTRKTWENPGAVSLVNKREPKVGDLLSVGQCRSKWINIAVRCAIWRCKSRWSHKKMLYMWWIKKAHSLGISPPTPKSQKRIRKICQTVLKQVKVSRPSYNQTSANQDELPTPRLHIPLTAMIIPSTATYSMFGDRNMVKPC